MNLLNQIRLFNAIPPAAIKDDAAFASYVIDKQTDVPTGCKGVCFIGILGSIDATLAALKVQQSDTKTDPTTLGGTPADVDDAASKPGADDDNEIVVLYVPMAAWTERYLQLQATAGNGAAGTYFAAVAVFDLPGEGGASTTLLNALSLDIA